MSNSVRPHRRQPTRLPGPWDSPGKNTGVGCHFLLQCMKVKSESEVAQSCLTLSDPMDCGLPGSSIHGIFQARALEWGATAFSDTKPRISHYHNWAYVILYEIQKILFSYMKYSTFSTMTYRKLYFICEICTYLFIYEIQKTVTYKICTYIFTYEIQKTLHSYRKYAPIFSSVKYRKFYFHIWNIHVFSSVKYIFIYEICIYIFIYEI